MNIIANCYNNGNIAIWGLLSNKRLHTFSQVHDKYTYKIRFQSPNILVSCGADCSVIRTDLEKQKYISNFSHPLPVWCAHPIDSNQIATVGLFGRVFVWDVRANRVVQFCNNKRNESSFITTRNVNEFKVFYGDEALLNQWDRRKSKP
jgi:WD40 repeat protein